MIGTGSMNWDHHHRDYHCLDAYHNYGPLCSVIPLDCFPTQVSISYFDPSDA